MCGIAGIFGVEKNIENKTNKMLRIIKHRGPDKTHQIKYKNFCGGTVRLSIEAIKDGSQPIEDDNIIVGFNGEIFNYKELSKKYKLNNQINSEILIIKKIYTLLGVNFINELQGQFAIFIYDKSKEEVLLFRDHYGIRPLFYHLNKKVFFFSSEMKSIVTASNEKFSINSNSIASTALFWTNIGDLTSIKNIFQIEPGHFLKFNGKKITQTRYYKDPLHNSTKISNKKDTVYRILKKSIKNQLQSEVGYACSLSGGIDSSAVAYILSKLSRKKIDTFSLAFEDESYDESKFQKKIAKLIKSNHHSIRIKKKDISDNFEKTIYHAENIIFRTAPVPMFLLYKLISKNNHKVVFSGEGSDEIALGYDIFFENRLRRKWNLKTNSKKIIDEFSKLYNYLPQFKDKRYLKLSLDFFKKFKKTKKNDIYFSHLARWSQFDQISKYFKLKKNSKRDLMLKLGKVLKKKEFKKIDDDKKCQLIEFNTLLSNYLLSSQGDRMSMANSIEGRYPFLDHNFINYFSKIRSSNKAPNNSSKKLLRDSFKNKIPAEIQKRPKTAYQAPEAKAFLDTNYLSDPAKEFLKNFKKLKYFNNKNVENLVKKITHPYSSKRLGFRENMGFIMCLSVYFLHKSIISWKNFK
tara:strand:- start:639 stop:2537 length:1899 start_codon:yes stop_codon:yes gene_type:complete